MLVLVSLSIYSYALVDPNFTLINHPLWEVFRNFMVPLGYYHRDWSFGIYVILLTLLTGFSFYFWKKNLPAFKLAVIVAGALLLSYPFLSHDFFNYLYDAKIVTVYGKSPYLYKALDFPHDPWLRFMHWTHRTYPYGPSFLLFTLVPSFLSFGKLGLAFGLFKLLFAGFYLLAVYALQKVNNRAAVFLATSPLVIIEGLVNNHNDLIAVGLAIYALYLFTNAKHKGWGILAGLASVGIKYFTMVLAPLLIKHKKMPLLVFGLFLVGIFYISLRVGIHPWYFLNLAVFLLYTRRYFLSGTVLSLGLLLSYFPYIVYGGWDQEWKVVLKEQIIWVSLALFLLSLFWNKQLHNLFYKSAPREG